MSLQFVKSCCSRVAIGVHGMITLYYITYCRPLGKVRNIWHRWESQDLQANLAHIHALISLEPGETDQQKLDRICCQHNMFFTKDFGTGRKQLLAEGLVKDNADWIKLTSQLVRSQMHSCANAKFRCMKVTGHEGKTVCR